MKRVGVATFAIFQALAGPALAGETLKPCPFPVIPAAQPPGPKLLTSYASIRDQVPRSAGCDVMPKDIVVYDYACEFVDRYGYVDQISPWERDRNGRLTERRIYLRFGSRERRPILPYGVAWNDTPAKVARKMAAVGAKPETGVWESKLFVSTTTCRTRAPEDYVLVDFDFGTNGPLQSVTIKINFGV